VSAGALDSAGPGVRKKRLRLWDRPREEEVVNGAQAIQAGRTIKTSAPIAKRWALCTRPSLALRTAFLEVKRAGSKNSWSSDALIPAARMDPAKNATVENVVRIGIEGGLLTTIPGNVTVDEGGD
jgi:hypothetical protein